MKRIIEISIIIYFVITGLDMALGTDNEAWNRLYFLKENVMSCMLCFVLFYKSENTTQMIFIIAGGIFFALRGVFNIFAYEYSNNYYFGITFACILILLLSILMYQIKWRT